MITDNINLNIENLYELQLKYPDNFHNILENLCSKSFDYLISELERIIQDLKDAASEEEKSYRDEFTALEEMELEFQTPINNFSLFRKTVVFENETYLIRGKDIEKVFKILSGKVTNICKKYPSTHNYRLTPEQYQIESTGFIEEMEDVIRVMQDLDEDFLKFYKWVTNDYNRID